MKHNLRAKRQPGARKLPPLLLMTDEDRLPDPLSVVDRLPSGAGIILRHYRDGLEGARRRELAHALAAACRRTGRVLLVAASPRLALEVGAQGVHLPEWAVRRNGFGLRLGRNRRDWLVTAASHSPAALRAAKRAGADAALLAPVFATASHPDVTAIGALRFAAWAQASPLPVYALGGISARNVGRIGAITKAPVAGIAGIGGLLTPRRGG
jgi:thiamine-phosphate pyrophosphorylase